MQILLLLKHVYDIVLILVKSRLQKWSLRYGHFCHFSSKLKTFESGFMWFQFCCHFHPKSKFNKIFQLIFSFFFVFFLPFNEGQNGLLTFYYNKLKKSDYFALC
ncbi:hypothetical protein Hanom_Chr06g00530051 [Helianthus anomalus]